MNPISSIIPQRIATPEAARPALSADPAAQEARPGPGRDEYLPREAEEPIGLYRIERDGEGNPRVSFDSPNSRPEEPEPEKAAERCTTDTGQVDREIENLRKREQQLKQSLRTETDEKKRSELERRLTQVQSELMQKDNDTYRRSHAVIS